MFWPTGDGDGYALRGKGWGYGEIIKALYLAQKSGKNVGAIVGMRASGMGWGEIVRKLGLPPGDLGKAEAAERSCGGGPSGEKGK